MGITRRPPIRASDAERAAAERVLRHHFAAGRLDADELEDRLEAVQHARSRRDTEALLRDLPRLRRPPRWMGRVHRVLVSLHATGYVAYNGGFVGMWALTGGGTFWPAIPLAGGGALLAWHAWGVPAAVKRFYSD